MHILDNISLLEKLDTEDMYHKIIHIPEHILEAYGNSDIFKPDSRSDRIVTI